MFHQYLYQTKENLFNIKQEEISNYIYFILLPGTNSLLRLDIDDIFECVLEFSRRL